MRRARAVLLAIWDFLVGDDWRTAIGVAIALGVTALVAESGANPWWLMPIAVLGLLSISLRREARRASRRS